MGSLEAALTELRSLDSGESINYTKMAKKHGVRELIRYIEKLTQRGLPPTRQIIQNFAACIAKIDVTSLTYNMDEKGFLLSNITRSKRVFSRQMYERKEVRQAIQDGNRSWISLLACIYADGSAIEPALIY
ncbi:uncharacterized protein BDR25DRAFT_326053 [Lindgomyces ingoldianus]|uniref:Uncharacterized protein n=1 Tax=Lindgomyces ingoldianus TaxID=673940 RepID=A0ACB6QSL4_9PLEO|nr:uncharacterized protein BDR25DRAFT_326053 [Lindgomyces ingoldianus]KAF2469553.1 hypothetical protein BDR25DRAFT_326053 [Lindgomyces ingoldianus]